MITGERLTGEKWQGRDRGPSASSTDNSSHHASPQRRSDPPPEDPLDINGNRSSSEGPINDTTGSNSQETVFASESRGYERERSEAMQERERHRDSSQPASPRARSSSRHRYPSNSPDTRSRLPSSPAAERPANRELRRVNDEGPSGEGDSHPPRDSPVPHSSRDRRGHNGKRFPSFHLLFRSFSELLCQSNWKFKQQNCIKFTKMHHHMLFQITLTCTCIK